MTRAADIDEQAARWLIRMDAEGADPRETVLAEFEIWAGADLRHRAAFLRLSAAWANSGRLRGLAPPGAPINPDLLSPYRAWPRRMRPMWSVGVAATIAALAVFCWGQLRPVSTSYSTDVGGFSRLLLGDGSVVSLNTYSEIRVRLSRSAREVTLVRGEAIFDVAHDRARPFNVHAASSVVRAVGTSFDVRRFGGDEVAVVVTEGRVAVDGPAMTGLTGTNGQGPVIVAAGEAATTKAGRMDVRRIEAAEAARRLAWQGGQVSFQGEALAEVVDEFNRYNRRQLVLSDASLGTLKIGGSFKTTDMDSFAAALHTSLGLHVVEESPGLLQIRRDLSSSEPALPASVTKK